MEPRTEFNLDKNLVKWKSDLQQTKQLTSANILELESHFIESVDALRTAGLNEEEAFIITKKRIGYIDDLGLEYGKVNSTFSIISKTTPYTKGALFLIAGMLIAKLLLLSLLLVTDSLSIDSTTFNSASIILLISLYIGFFGLLYINIKKRTSFLTKINKIHILVLIILGTVFVNALLSRLPLQGINPLTGNEISNGFNSYILMDYNYAMFKAFIGFILVGASVFLFFKQKRQNALNIVN